MDDDKIFGNDLVEDVIPKKAPLLDDDVVDENLEDSELEEEGTDGEEEEDEY